MSRSPDDVMSLVAGQHARIRGLLRDSARSGGPERALAFTRLARYLAIHEAAEQVGLHGQAVSRQRAGAATSQERIIEECQASILVERLFELDPDSHAFGVQLAVLEEAVLKHANAEETQELPALLADLDEEDIRAARVVLEVVDDVFEQDGDDSPVPAGIPFGVQHKEALALFGDRMGAGHRAR